MSQVQELTDSECTEQYIVPGWEITKGLKMGEGRIVTQVELGEDKSVFENNMFLLDLVNTGER